MSGEFYIAGQAGLWLQANGANTKPKFLGCHGLEDIEDPTGAGELTLLYCPDPSGQGHYQVVGSYTTPSTDPVSTTIVTRVGKVRDLLEQAVCRGNLFVHKADCGRRDVFSNYQRSFILRKFQLGARTYSGLASMQPDDEAVGGLSIPLQAEELLQVASVFGGLMTVGSPGDLLDLATLYDAECAGECGAGKGLGQHLVAVGEPLTGSAAAVASVYTSADYGATWAATAADPFGAGETISSVVVVQTVSGPRIIVARGTTDAANPAEVAYSDDLGATWISVDVGATDGQYVLGPHAMYALDANNIWLVAADGYVYFSDDAGETWATLEDGSLLAKDFYAVVARTTSDIWVAGQDNSILHSETAGASWDVITGPVAEASAEINTIWPVTEQRVFVGYSDGTLWYTEDQGDNWAQRDFSGDAVGSVQTVQFLDELVGYLVHNTAAPVGRVLRTIDGGYTWDTVQVPANGGLNGILALETNHVLVAGNVVGGVGVIVEVAELGV